MTRPPLPPSPRFGPSGELRRPPRTSLWPPSRPRRRPRPGAALLLLITAGLIPFHGCAGDDNTVDALTGTAAASADPLPEAAAGGDYDLPLKAAPEVLDNTLDALHWGKLSIKETESAVEAEAITPADQTVTIRADPGEGEKLRVRVRVGFFGHDRLEARFHEQLGEEARKWRREQRE